MEVTHKLQCLGLPALHAPSGDLVRFRTKKHLALLVYLAVEPRSAHRRERLADLFWPNATPAEGRHSLATALSVLRAKLGRRAFETGRDHIRLATTALALDVERLAAGEVLGSEFVPPLEVAGFLDGFDLPDAPEFMLWKDRQHARWLPSIKEALVRLMDLSRRTGGSRQMELLADRMLALDELSEEAIRAKMEARAFAGDRLTALKIFEEWKAKLAEELGALPSDLVEGMALRLRRRGLERSTASDIPTVRTDQWRDRTFVGRSAEHRMLYEAWERMRQGTPGHGLVLGDSGIGKTTLVERLTTAAGLEGAAVSRVQCYDLEREIPYATLGSLVQGLLTAPGVSGTPPEALAELARTIPEVRHRFPVLPPSIESQGETARIRLTEAVHQLLGSIADEHPVILVVDDLHFADDASLAVLHLVMRKAKGQPIMAIFTARPGELRQSPQASRLREAGPALGLVEVELAPLTEEESLEMLDSLVATEPARPGATVRRTLVRAARGYPMVLVLLVQDWQAHGDQSLALSVDAMTAELGGPGIPAAAYRRILDRLISGLELSTASVLNLASLLGHRLNELSMYTLVDLTIGQTMAGMGRLSSLRLLRDGGGKLEFANELVRAYVYLAVPSTVRRTLHGEIADRLIAAAERGRKALGLEIAWHCIRGGRSEEATRYLLTGAREAIRYGALDGAERGLSTALPALREPKRSEAAVLLVEVYQEQGRWSDSLELVDTLPADSTVVSPDLRWLFRTAAQRRLGFFAARELTALASDLLSFIRRTSDIRTQVRAALETASLLNTLRLGALAPEALSLFGELESASLSDDQRVELLLAKAMLHYNLRDTASSLEHIAAAEAILEADSASNSLLARVQLGLGAINCSLGGYAQAIRHYDQASAISGRIGNDWLLAQTTANAALCHARLGHYDLTIQCAGRVSRIIGDHGVTQYFLQLSQSLLIAYAIKGMIHETEDLISSARERIRDLQSETFTQAWDLYSADALLLLGRPGPAELLGLRATSGANLNLLSDFCAGPFARWVARTAVSRARNQDGIGRLRRLETTLESYDCLDQLEILNATYWLCTKVGTSRKELDSEIRERLGALPIAVGQQLRQMGMLPS